MSDAEELRRIGQDIADAEGVGEEQYHGSLNDAIEAELGLPEENL
jgi:hypothetical protein